MNISHLFLEQLVRFEEPQMVEFVQQIIEELSIAYRKVYLLEVLARVPYLVIRAFPCMISFEHLILKRLLPLLLL